MQRMWRNVLQVPGEPHRRVGAIAELPDDLVLAVAEDVAEDDGVITTWAVVLYPLTG